MHRRSFLLTAAGSVCASGLQAQEAVTQPVVSATEAPLEIINPVAHDGHQGVGLLRKPPGKGPFPAVIFLHGGICATVAEEPASMLMAGMYNTRIPKKGERYTPKDSFFLMENPRQHYTPEFQAILREKVAKIDCPILIIQGDAERNDLPINKFNAEVLIPELRAANKTFAVRSYAGQEHCFCADSGVPGPSGRPAISTAPRAALEAYKEIEAFYRKNLPIEPRNIEARLVTHVPVRTAW